jgi:hypothetical protein
MKGIRRKRARRKERAKLMASERVSRTGSATKESYAVEPTVSDHAVVRFLERCEGVRIQDVRAAILGGGRADLIRKVKSGTIPYDERVRLVVRNGAVVTVVSAEGGGR